ncbi:hypothetical protein [Alkalihalobacillus pseudalcaliphilus]|nr:hypothetical protein [Alkalihalobacillus pseudalcaliphilus]
MNEVPTVKVPKTTFMFVGGGVNGTPPWVLYGETEKKISPLGINETKKF